MRLGDEVQRAVEVIHSGILPLDVALGIGGVPRGRIVEIFGPEGGGKTTIALHILAEAQKAGGIAAFIDAEHALDPRLAASLASTPRTSTSRSPTAANRPSTSSTPSSAAAR